MKLSISAFAAALLLAAAPAQSQVVETQLDSAVTLMAREGFVPMGLPSTGSLEAGESASFEMHMDAGTYMILGVCDRDCSDLDLVLRSRGGDEVDADREPDDVPMVRATITTAGTYVLAVEMHSCSVEPCGWGVRMFRRR